MSEQRPQIHLPNLCQTHQVLLVRQMRYKETDPWRALIIATQIALFQAATCDDKTYVKLGRDVTRVPELGCLACYKPDAFGSIVDAGQTNGLAGIKKYGEDLLEQAQQRKNAESSTSA